MSAIHAFAAGLCMLGSVVFVRGRIRMVAVIDLGLLRDRRTIFFSHGMAGGGITAEGQSKHHEKRQKFHI